MQNVRKIEGNGTIKRPEEQQYNNTTILPHERTVNSISYYNRRKKQLKRNPSNDVIISLTNRYAERSDLKDHIQSIFMTTKSIDPFISNYIKEIRGDPVINDNKFTNFNEELYPLNQDEKVKVLEERYFPLQNYYNYIYDLELKKDLSRFAVEEKVMGVAMSRERISDRSLKIEEVDSVNQRNSLAFQDILQQKPTIKDRKVKGYYESKFEPKLRNNKVNNGSNIRQSTLQPKPIGRESAFRFTVNQDKRMLLSSQLQFRPQ